MIYFNHQVKEVTQMTREEKILDELNRAEQKLKVFLEKEEDRDEAAIDEQLAYINGMKRILTLLGYRAVEDENKGEFISEYWVYTYKAIEDTTGRKG
jgi:hypothetical protein